MVHGGRDQRFLELVRFKDRVGHCSPCQIGPNRRLGVWVAVQRVKYRKVRNSEMLCALGARGVRQEWCTVSVTPSETSSMVSGRALSEFRTLLSLTRCTGAPTFESRAAEHHLPPRSPCAHFCPPARVSLPPAFGICIVYGS